MTISRQFQRIAKRLTVLDLVGSPDSPDAIDEFALLGGDRSSYGSERFLGYYSIDGIRRAYEAYGIHGQLEELGLGHYEIKVSCDDGSRHRVQILLDGIVDDDHRIIDFIVRPITVGAATLTEGRTTEGFFNVLLVEWLCLQNPLGQFTKKRPRLPGQVYPGLGLGYAAHNVSLLIAQRLGYHGVVNVPEHYHLAVAYDRVGYHFVSKAHDLEVKRVIAGTSHLHFACAAWAAERRLLRVNDALGNPTPKAWIYNPAEMLAPVSESLDDLLSSFKKRLCRFHKRDDVPMVTVDLDLLRQSFIEKPVDGIDPSAF